MVKDLELNKEIQDKVKVLLRAGGLSGASILSCCKDYGYNAKDIQLAVGRGIDSGDFKIGEELRIELRQNLKAPYVSIYEVD